MPNAKPTDEHRRAGTYREARHAARLDSAIANAKPPEKPSDLPPTASTLWDEAVATLGLALWSTDAALLESCCRWFAQLNGLQLRLMNCDAKDEHKLTVLASLASKNFRDLASKLGLTPADRPKLQTHRPAVEKPKSPLELLRQLKS